MVNVRPQFAHLGGAAGARPQFARMGASISSSVQPQFAGVRGTGVGSVRAQFSRLEASGAMIIDAGLGGQANPFDLCQLNAVVTTTGMTADSWVWALESVASLDPAHPVVDPPVASLPLVGIGPSRTYQAPATYWGVALTFRATAYIGAVASGTDTVIHSIKAHAWNWSHNLAGQEIAIPAGRIPASTGLFGLGAFGTGPYGV